MLMTFDRRVPLMEQRLRVLEAKQVRKHPKRHGTGKRSAAQKLARKRRAQLKAAMNNKAQQRYRSAVRAYWAGEAECHP